MIDPGQGAGQIFRSQYPEPCDDQIPAFHGGFGSGLHGCGVGGCGFGVERGTGCNGVFWRGPHRVEVTLMKMFSVRAKGLAQMFVGHLNAFSASPKGRVCADFRVLCFLVMVLGLMVYAFAQNRVD